MVNLHLRKQQCVGALTILAVRSQVMGGTQSFSVRIRRASAALSEGLARELAAQRGPTQGRVKVRDREPSGSAKTPV